MPKSAVFIFLLSVLLSLIGIFILYVSSTYTAQLSIGDKYYFVKNQATWFILGIVLCFVVSKIDYKKYYKLALPLLLLTFVLLVLVFVPGIGLELKGAKRWLDLGFTVLQPSEILKITLTIYLAAWLSAKEKGRLIAFIMLFSLSALLVVAQPDLGTAFIVAATSTIVYFLSGASLRDMALVAVLLGGSVFALIKVAPYRLERLLSFQNFDQNNIASAPYHIKQTLIALGSGGLLGLGFGNSIQKYAYLPEATTDSIFAIFAEEAGFVGATMLIGCFIALTIIGFYIAGNARDAFGKLLAGGIISFISIQAFINLASQVVLVPLTGVPLPFISYGGSSLIINFIAIGILMNIARHKA
jgi:cell division protein FtsW